MKRSGIPFLIAGAFAKYAYTGIWRNTKDLDVFLQAADVKKAFDALSAAGFKTEVLYKHWLARAVWEPEIIDLVFGIGYALLEVS